eukprot:13838852-Alexandrium_andersonii.AAC.1
MLTPRQGVPSPSRAGPARAQCGDRHRQPEDGPPPERIRLGRVRSNPHPPTAPHHRAAPPRT